MAVLELQAICACGESASLAAQIFGKPLQKSRPESGEGASPDSFPSFRPAVAQLTNRKKKVFRENDKFIHRRYERFVNKAA